MLGLYSPHPQSVWLKHKLCDIRNVGSFQSSVLESVPVRCLNRNISWPCVCLPAHIDHRCCWNSDVWPTFQTSKHRLTISDRHSSHVHFARQATLSVSCSCASDSSVQQHRSHEHFWTTAHGQTYLHNQTSARDPKWRWVSHCGTELYMCGELSRK